MVEPIFLKSRTWLQMLRLPKRRDEDLLAGASRGPAVPSGGVLGRGRRRGVPQGRQQAIRGKAADHAAAAAAGGRREEGGEVLLVLEVTSTKKSKLEVIWKTLNEDMHPTIRGQVFGIPSSEMI